jgi:hypothetical protein
MNIKRHISFVFLLLISFKILIVPFVYLDFELRKEYIIQHYCENRFAPQLHCEGKCYLAKQLQKVAQDHARTETEKQAENIKKLLSDIYDDSCFSTLFLSKSTQLRQTSRYYLAYISSDFFNAILHPPTV